LRFSLLILAAVVTSFVSMGLLLRSVSESEARLAASRLRPLLMEINDQHLKHLVQVVHSELVAVVKLRDSGLLTAAEARKVGADLVRQVGYDDTGYFWADDYRGVNVVLLGSPTEGTHRWDARDIDGKYFIRELSIAGRQPGGGFVDYRFPRPGQTTPVAKRGYAFAFEPFGWVIGTGNYLDDIEAQVSFRADETRRVVAGIEIKLFATLAVVLVVVLGVAVFLSLRITRPLRQLRERFENLASNRPNLDVVIETRSRDDIAQLINSFNLFMARYRVAFRHQHSYQILTEKLALLAEAHDAGTAVHTVRVGELSSFLARRLGMAPQDCEAIRVAAALHDVGKLFLDPQLLNKQGKLTPEERSLLQRHTVLAETLLDGPEFELERTIAVHHHERYDGSGYPHGLKGDEIPFAAQIVGAADVYDALRSVRSYKDALGHAETLRIMRDGEGAMGGGGFNPAILTVLEESLEVLEATFYADNRSHPSLAVKC